MPILNIHEAKTHFSRLVDQVARGKEIIIGKAGKPVAKLIPYKVLKRPRKPGSLKGKIWIAKDFDELSPQVLAGFLGKER